MSGALGTPLLEVRNLVKHFGGVSAVDDVSFKVYPGQIVSIIGPNGSGKTTTFNLVSGHLRADAGTVLLEGNPLGALTPDRIAARGLARTFQNGRVFGNMTVEENLLVGRHTRLAAQRPCAALREWPLARWVPLLAETAMALARPSAVEREESAARVAVEAQLARFGERLLPRREHYAYSLSYANRRRTEIGRALMLGPRLLLLDEPTAGMNPTETREVLHQIEQLQCEGLTVLLIEHKLDLVMTLSDHVIVLDDGKVIAAGQPTAVQRDPAVIEAYLGRGPESTKPREHAATAPHAASPATSSPLLALRDVDVFYGPVQALAKVSLHVGAAEIVCLLGGNASGKSTTMKTILGLLRPTSGTVSIQGVDATALPTSARILRGLAAVPEARRVFPAMTVEENLYMGAFLRTGRAEIRADLERMYTIFPRLAERRLQLAGTLSGGEQQMLAMARALMSRPQLICMDEPTMGLAPIFVERVLDTIASIRRQGVSVFMVEQNAKMALSIADRGYVIQNGVIVLSSSAQALLQDPAVQDAYLGRHASELAD
ncbi:MAG TPA: ATP-binding cassette domain-containing protein [Casimicrobiaceae bacterium]|nr:ATP-binding cassette domain-containing protein [Casimicrobiaceae bacterium]